MFEVELLFFIEGIFIKFFIEVFIDDVIVCSKCFGKEGIYILL